MVSIKALIDMGEIEATGAIKKLDINNYRQDTFKVYRIPLNFLYYNNQNGRINTTYTKFVADKNQTPTPSTDDENKEYNNVFQKFIYKSNEVAMKDTIDSIRKKNQQEPGVVLNDGRIIDGNRRYTALRIIQNSSGKQQFFEAVVLDFDIEKDVDAKKIKQLELDLQMGHESPVQYDPIDRVFDVYDTIEVEKLLTKNEYASSIGKKSTAKIESDIKEAKLIIGFLKFINAPERAYYIAKDLKLDGPMHEINRTLNKYKGSDAEKDQITESINATLVTLYQSDSGDTTRELRKILNNVVSTTMNRDFLDQSDDLVDDIYDELHKNKIESVQQLSQAVNRTPEAKKSIDDLGRLTRHLTKRGQSDANRLEILNQLIDCQDVLENITPTDISNLSANEFTDASKALRKILKYANKLKEVEINV